MDVQALVNEMNAQAQLVRAATQMTLGKLIKRFGELPAGLMIDSLGPHSYRGYYCDLALEPYRLASRQTVADTLNMLKDCVGREFEGYKGGEYVMDENTPVWIASYGCCGERIMGVNDDGTFETEQPESVW